MFQAITPHESTALTAMNYIETDNDIRTNSADATITIVCAMDQLLAEAAEIKTSLLARGDKHVKTGTPVDMNFLVEQVRHLYADEVFEIADTHTPDEAYEGCGDLDVDVVIEVVDDAGNTVITLRDSRSFEDLSWMEQDDHYASENASFEAGIMREMRYANSKY